MKCNKARVLVRQSGGDRWLERWGAATKRTIEAEVLMDEIHFAPLRNHGTPIVCWYLQGNHHSRVSWAVRNGFRPSTVNPRNSPKGFERNSRNPREAQGKLSKSKGNSGNPRKKPKGTLGKPKRDPREALGRPADSAARVRVFVLRFESEAVGHLLRSKGQQTKQGGVFVGNAPRSWTWPAVEFEL